MFLWIAGIMMLVSIVASAVLWAALRTAQLSIEAEPTLFESARIAQPSADDDEAFETPSPAVAALTFRWQQ